MSVALLSLFTSLEAKSVIATVGRSSVLKMKPTPQPPSQIMQVRRPRSTTRISASKRKVLMDDTMVLHGEYVILSFFNLSPPFLCLLEYKLVVSFSSQGGIGGLFTCLAKWPYLPPVCYLEKLINA